jgi:hypothetical protein
MQQLTWQFTLDEIIIVECRPSPDWGLFPQIAETFCEHAKVQKIEIHIGADRAQLHFRSKFGDFLLLYPSDLKIQSSAGIQIVKYKAFVLGHSFPMSNTDNAVVGD